MYLVVRLWESDSLDVMFGLINIPQKHGFTLIGDGQVLESSWPCGLSASPWLAPSCTVPVEHLVWHLRTSTVAHLSAMPFKGLGL